MNTPSRNALSARWQAAWAQRTPRERQLVSLAAAVLGVGLVWGALLQPAARSLSAASERRAAVEATLERMRLLAAEAQGLKAVAATAGAAPDAARTATLLQEAARQLDAQARWQWDGSQGTLNFENAPAPALQAYLVQVREGARARVAQARWSVTPQGLSGELRVVAGDAR